MSGRRNRHFPSENSCIKRGRAFIICDEVLQRTDDGRSFGCSCCESFSATRFDFMTGFSVYNETIKATGRLLKTERSAALSRKQRKKPWTSPYDAGKEHSDSLRRQRDGAVRNVASIFIAVYDNVILRQNGKKLKEREKPNSLLRTKILAIQQLWPLIFIWLFNLLALHILAIFPWNKRSMCSVTLPFYSVVLHLFFGNFLRIFSIHTLHKVYVVRCRFACSKDLSKG